MTPQVARDVDVPRPRAASDATWVEVPAPRRSWERESARSRCRDSRLKRVTDRLGAVVGLVLLSPLIATVATWIRVVEGGPVLFRQQRAGLEGEPFEMLKFRTMVPDAIEIGRRMAITEDPFGIVENDPRITRSGRLLRRTSLDELPQLVNVLRGEMSLVGPRPDVLPQVALYTDEERRRLDVRPGLTGWVQVNGRDELPWAERFPLDAWYIDHWSLALDLRILRATIRSVGHDEPAVVEDDFHIRRLRDAGG